MNVDEYTDRIIEHYGAETQMHVAIEECSELIQALTKTLRGEDIGDNLREEIADVYVCLMELRKMIEMEDKEVRIRIALKLQRTVDRMEHGR